jgi:hypothetical protein
VTVESKPNNFISQITTLTRLPEDKVQVFRPEHDVLGPDEATQEWDPEAAHRRARERIDAAQVMHGMASLWHRRRRLVLLTSAALIMAVGLLGWELITQSLDDDPFATAVTVRPLPGPPANAPVVEVDIDGGNIDGFMPEDTSNMVLDEAKVDELVAHAVVMYQQGRFVEALRTFRVLAEAGDEAAVLGVQLLEARLGARVP